MQVAPAVPTAPAAAAAGAAAAAAAAAGLAPRGPARPPTHLKCRQPVEVALVIAVEWDLRVGGQKQGGFRVISWGLLDGGSLMGVLESNPGTGEIRRRHTGQELGEGDNSR